MAMIRYTTNQMARLAALEQAGNLTAEAVVTEATPPDSPLHDLFEWDDAEAAKAHRLQQARAVIRTIEVIITRNNVEITVPRYLPDPERRGHGGGYRSVESLAADREAAIESAIDEIGRALGMTRRAAQVAQALDVASDINQAVATLMRAKVRLQTSLLAMPEEATG